MHRIVVSIGGGLLLAVSLLFFTSQSDSAAAQGRNPQLARCTSPDTGELMITPGNREFCGCLGLKRTAKGKELYGITSAHPELCDRSDVTGSTAKAKKIDPPAAGGGLVGGAGGSLAGDPTDPVDTRPGWGWGDKNHDHTGPPGLANHDPPGQAKKN